MRTDSGEYDPFVEFYELINESKIQRKSEVDLNYFSDLLKHVEGRHAYFNNQKPNPRDNIFNAYLFDILFKFVAVFKIRGFHDDLLFNSFIIYLHYLLLVIENCSFEEKREEVIHNFYGLFPALRNDLNIDVDKEFMVDIPNDYWGIDKFERSFSDDVGIGYKDRESSNNPNPDVDKPQESSDKQNERSDINRSFLKNFTLPSKFTITTSRIFNDFYLYCGENKVKEYRWKSTLNKFTFIRERWYCNMNFYFSSSEKAIKINVPNFSFCLWALSTALENINEVEVELKEIRIGSIFAFLRIWMNTDSAKIEVKNVLTEGRAAALREEYKSKKDTKDIYNTFDKLTNRSNETIKLDEEDPEYNELKKERLRLENDRMRLENRKMEISYVNDLRTLVKEGLLAPDTLDTYINSHIYTSRKNGEFSGRTPDVNI